MNNDDVITRKISEFITISEKLIQKEGLEAVKHYFEHNEYEMAFEGLIIELLNINVYPSNFDVNEWIEIGLKCKLDTLANFDDKMWDKFLLWCGKYNKQSK